MLLCVMVRSFYQFTRLQPYGFNPLVHVDIRCVLASQGSYLMVLPLSTGRPFKIDHIPHMAALVLMDFGQHKPNARK